MTGSGGNIVQKELNETVVRSREEIEEKLETEDCQQLGDISDEVCIYTYICTHAMHPHLNSTCACRREYGFSAFSFPASHAPRKGRAVCSLFKDSPSHLITHTRIVVLGKDVSYVSSTGFGQHDVLEDLTK